MTRVISLDLTVGVASGASAIGQLANYKSVG